MTDEQKAKMSPEHRSIVGLCELAEHLFEALQEWEKLGDQLSEFTGIGNPPKIDEDGSGLAGIRAMKKTILEAYS